MKDFLQPSEIKIKKSLSLTKSLFVNKRVALSTVSNEELADCRVE